MKNVTFSADERLIDLARQRARRERSTLNEEFRRWLAAYAGADERADRAMETIADLPWSEREGRVPVPGMWLTPYRAVLGSAVSRGPFEPRPRAPTSTAS